MLMRSMPEPSLDSEPVPPIAWLSVSVEPDETSKPPSKVDQLTLLVDSEVMPAVRRMPPAKVRAAVGPPMLENAEICSVPPSSRVPPPYVFVLLSTRTPAPRLVTKPLLLIAWLTVNVLL